LTSASMYSNAGTPTSEFGESAILFMATRMYPRQGDRCAAEAAAFLGQPGRRQVEVVAAQAVRGAAQVRSGDGARELCCDGGGRRGVEDEVVPRVVRRLAFGGIRFRIHRQRELGVLVVFEAGEVVDRPEEWRGPHHAAVQLAVKAGAGAHSAVLRPLHGRRQ